MSNLPHNHRRERKEHEEKVHHHKIDASVPYWKKAHRDWRFWVALLLMLGVMVAYLVTDDEAFRSAGPPQRPVPALGG